MSSILNVELYSSLSAREIREFRAAFTFFDKDGDGTITTAELGRVMRGFGHDPSEVELQELLSVVDKNCNGTLDFEEFLTLGIETKKAVENTATATTESVRDRNSHHLQKRTEVDREIRRVFDAFDNDGSGYIGAEELQRGMLGLGEHLTDGEVEELLVKADLDGDGYISFKEFQYLLSLQVVATTSVVSGGAAGIPAATAAAAAAARGVRGVRDSSPTFATTQKSTAASLAALQRSYKPLSR